MSKSKRIKTREMFQKAGFNFHEEFIRALSDADPQTRLEALVSVAPFFMERLKAEPEVKDDSIDVTPKLNSASEAELLAIVSGKKK